MPATRRSRFRSVVSRLKAFSSYVDAFTTWGTKWKVTSGSWTTSSSKSKTTTSASSYPLAAVQMSKSNVTATVKSPQPGAGIALWVTDSGNWWGVVREQTINNSYNCGTCTGSFTNPYFYFSFTNPPTPGNSGTNPPPGGTTNPTNPGTWNAASYFFLAIFGKTYYNPPTQNPPPGGTTNPTNPGNPFSNPPTPGNTAYGIGGGNTSYFFFTCNCSTSYPQSIRLIRSVAGTVSQITSWSVGAVTDTINAIRVSNSGTGITIKAYSDTNATTQLGSDLTYTASGATVSTQFGIVIAPATNGQGDGTGELSITSN